MTEGIPEGFYTGELVMEILHHTIDDVISTYMYRGGKLMFMHYDSGICKWSNCNPGAMDNLRAGNDSKAHRPTYILEMDWFLKKEDQF